MLSATDFFPSLISELMNLVTSGDWYSGSGRMSRFATKPRLGIPSRLLRPGPLGPVLGPALLPPLDAHRVQGSADHVIAHSGKVLHAAAPDHHDRVLLEVVPDARDVGRDLDPVRQPHARHLAERRVRLLRRGRVDAHAHAALLRRGPERRTLRPVLQSLPAVPDELTDRRQRCPRSFLTKNPQSLARGKR